MYQSAENIWTRLQRSPFRMKFHLNAKDNAYLQQKGTAVILSHAYDFIDARLHFQTMTANKRQCVGIPCLLLSMRRQPAAADA